ncbi:ABC transporter permease [Streptococcus dentiloxodontae]
MNFIKRAWWVTKAKKGRTLLLTLVTSAILVFVLAGLTIKNAADSAVESAKSEAGATVTLQVNREAMMKAMNPNSNSGSSDDSSSEETNTTALSLATAQSILDKDGISSYLFTSTTTVSAGDGISAISTDSSSASSSSDSNSSMSDDGKGKMASGDFTITGVNATANATDFTSGTSEITDGEGITEDSADNSAVISSDLAKANNLQVGDTFSVTATVDGTESSYTLTVIGIYDNSSTATTAQMMSNASNPQNNIYTNLATANTLKGESDALDAAVYTLSNPEKVESFASEVESEIDTDHYSVTTSDEIYQQMLEPLNNISAIAQNIVILVAIAGAVILTLIVILNIRERRYEIGVLMSLGESRLKIIGQFFMELFMVTVVSVFIAIFAGNFIGNALGNQLLSSVSNTTQQVSQRPDENGGAPQPDTSNSSISNSDSNQKQEQAPADAPSGGSVMTPLAGSAKIDQLDIKLSAADVAKLGGIALLISFFSTILASIGIVRMKPKDILSSN